MIHAQSTTLFASSFARQLPAFAAPPVDGVTAKALRTITAKAARRTARRTRRSLTELFRAPVICTLPVADAPETRDSVLLLATEESGIALPPSLAERVTARLHVDVAWLTAVVIALSVTLALAIPLELFRQNG